MYVCMYVHMYVCTYVCKFTDAVTSDKVWCYDGLAHKMLFYSFIIINVQQIKVANYVSSMFIINNHFLVMHVRSLAGVGSNYIVNI